MELPNIIINFKTAAAAAIQRSQKGTIGIIVQETATEAIGKVYRMTSTTDIPTGLSADNRRYIERAFLGYVNPPREVIVYVQDGAAADFKLSLGYFATIQVDYLCGPPTCTPDEALEIATWVKSRRADDFIDKAVLPNTVADNEGIVNFVAEEIKVGEIVFAAPAYCSRIAGLLAGTPMTIACTYAPLLEVVDVKRMTKAERQAAVTAGKFILLHDGEKVKVESGINSLTTTTQDKGEAFRKIKIVETMDMIRRDIRKTCQDGYIGKYANSYDNKCLLMTAIKGYFESLENEGILDKGKSVVELDMVSQETWLKSQGVDTSKMNTQQIKEANTGNVVFIVATVKILDAIEIIKLAVTV